MRVWCSCIAQTETAEVKYEEDMETGQMAYALSLPWAGPSEGDGAREMAKDSMFAKGQSRRIWSELYKVVDSSDVIVQALLFP